MAVSKEQLAQIIGKARDLCNPEGDALVESYRGQNNNGNGNDPDPSQYNDYSNYDRMYLNEDEDYQPQTIVDDEVRYYFYKQEKDLFKVKTLDTAAKRHKTVKCLKR